MTGTKSLVFSVKRNDSLYDFASTFDEMFGFTPFKEEQPGTSTGVRYQDSLGFDFQHECSPYVLIAPPSGELKDGLDSELSAFEVNVTIEDLALGIRELYFSIGLDELQDQKRVDIDLDSLDHLSFYRGFEIRCSVSKSTTEKTTEKLVWHRSQLLHSASYLVKASVEEALFDISWLTFQDEAERENVFMYVNWKSAEVSTIPSMSCFDVVGNNDLKDQFKRLDNNRHFGPLCIRMTADQILKDIVINCLKYCDLSLEPVAGSLHEKISQLFEKHLFDYTSMAKKIQGTNHNEQLSVYSDVSKLLQQINKIGANLLDTQFGGYR
ncbi:MAG: hypothetical protein JAY72_12485 [Candidatus Thiodiazotropha endolucinida]|nr:hypothetical protein [Candidatus Thiodiazotropha taylori]MCW4322493.1 hypothetical protein [Candidatus Thiodiazotropha taylori]